MNVDFKGYNENVATFVADETVKEGTLVKMNGNFTVTACTGEDDFIGVCVNARGGYAGVQTAGYAEVSATGMIETGYAYLGAGDEKTVTAKSSGNRYLVVNSTENTIGFIL